MQLPFGAVKRPFAAGSDILRWKYDTIALENKAVVFF